jgi:type IV pilus assembly protein PilZ
MAEEKKQSADDVSSRSTIRTLKVKITNTSTLYSSFMPFLKGGGIFIPTKEMHALGEQVNLKLVLVEMDKIFDVTGVIVWVTPTAAQSNRKQGVGVQFTSDNAHVVSGEITNYVGELLTSEKPTFTL